LHLVYGLNHPNIIKIIDYYETDSKLLCIIMEYAEEGDLN